MTWTSNFRRLHPQSFITVAFIFSEVERGLPPPPHPDGGKKPGLDRVKFEQAVAGIKLSEGLISCISRSMLRNAAISIPSLVKMVNEDRQFHWRKRRELPIGRKGVRPFRKQDHSTTLE